MAPFRHTFDALFRLRAPDIRLGVLDVRARRRVDKVHRVAAHVVPYACLSEKTVVALV